ncbi:MAG: hypothetical protein IPP82_00120 [Xanthomonadales bacterium]|nr:hypothetical protein [Xanthomonadales bacterium]
MRGSLPGVLRPKELIRENSSVLTYLILLLLAVIAVAVVVLLNRRARLRNFDVFAATAGRTLQLETCAGIKATNLYEYLCALASTLRTQAMLRGLELRPGEFKQVVTDAIESAYLLKRDESNKEVARGALLLFAFCLDPIMSKMLSGDATQGDEGNFAGTAAAVTLLASVGWHPESNADLVTCALSEISLTDDMAEYWRTETPVHRDQAESAFERVVRTALDPATAAYVRHKVFSDLQEKARTGV